MSIPPPTNPVGRLIRVYNAQERAAIDPFKTEYLAATTPAARKTIAQVHILPALFNYWTSTGLIIDDDEMRSRAVDLLKWVRNVWRPKSKPIVAQGATPRLTDVLWWTRKEAVMDQIASRMEIDSVDTSTRGWLGHRLPASIQILNAMSAEEKEALRDEADRLGKEGLPADVQRKLAEEKWYSGFTREAKQHYNSMGLLSVSVVAYTDKAGRFIIDVFDEIAGTLGLHSKSFEDMYEDLANEMKRAVLEYIKTIRNPTTGTGTGTGTDVPTIQADPDGFPMLPETIQWDKITKDNLEQLYRSYITMHYRLACRDRDRQAPFKKIASRPADFVDAKYLPNGLHLNDPRSMKLKAMINFFQHIEARQASHGVQDAFRFKSVLSRRNKGELHASKYPRNNSDSDEIPAPAPEKSQRKRKGKAKATENRNVHNTSSRQELMHAQYAFNTLDGPMTVTQTAQGASDNRSPDCNGPQPAAFDVTALTEAQQSQVFYDSGLLSLGLIRPPPPLVPIPQIASGPWIAIDPALQQQSAPVLCRPAQHPPLPPPSIPQIASGPWRAIDPEVQPQAAPVLSPTSQNPAGLSFGLPLPMAPPPVPHIGSGPGMANDVDVQQPSAPILSPASLQPGNPKKGPRARPIQRSSQRPAPVLDMEGPVPMPASASKTMESPNRVQSAASDVLVVTRSGRTVKPNTRYGQM